MIQFHLTAVVFLGLATVFSAQSVASAEAFNLKEDWERFYNAVAQSDAEQTLAIRNRLEPSEEALDLYVRAHSVLAARLTKLDRTDVAVETLERALVTKGEGRVSDSYAMAWSRALDKLCEALVKNGNLKQIPTRLSQYENQVSGYSQQASYASIQLKWKRIFHGTDAVTEAAQTTLAKFTKELPSEPTAIELETLLDIVQSPACFGIPLADRVSVLIRCRDVAQSSIRKHPDQALDFFRRTSEASYEAAKLYIKSNGVYGDVQELVECFEQCSQDLQSVSSDNSTRDFGNRAITDFRNYVRRRMERASNPKPTIYESPLIGKKAPDFNDAWAIQGRVPKSDGEIVILLDFWETWCGPCIAAFPKLNSLNDQYADKGLRVVGVAGLTRGVWDDETSRLTRDLTAEREPRLAAMKAFVQHHNLAGAQLVDETGTITKAFGVNSFPTYVLIDRGGNVQLVAGGGSETMAIIEKRIDELLGVGAQD